MISIYKYFENFAPAPIGHVMPPSSKESILVRTQKPTQKQMGSLNKKINQLKKSNDKY